MSSSQAEQLLETGLWLRLSGDQEWSQQFFEEALGLDSTLDTARKLLDNPPHLPAIDAQEQLWSLLPISIPQWPNPFQRPSAPSRSVGASSDWNQNTTWDASLVPPPEPQSPLPYLEPIDALPLEEIDLESLEDEPVASFSDELPPALPVEAEHEGPGSGLEEAEDLLKAAADFLELEDPEAAIELLGKAEQAAPDHPQLQKMRERAEAALQKVFEFRIGSLEAVPKVCIRAEQIVDLNLDHRAGFVLSQVDGVLSFEDLFSVSGMSRFDTTQILAQLLEQQVISRG